MSSESIEVGSNGVSSISFLPWSRELVQGITLRNLDGDPRKPFDLAFDTDDRTGTPSTDWRLFRESIAGPESIVVRMEQVHGARVEAIDRETLPGGGEKGGDLYLEGCDGLVTDSPGLLLTVRVADCVPVFLYDRRKGVIGLLHAGWRGTEAEILPTAVARMKDKYGSEATDIGIYLGPSIERTCYPVNRDVFRRFERWSMPVTDRKGGWKVDLRDINRQQAVASGISEDNILISRYCTACSEEILYSHRASRGDCGRMAAFSALR